MASKDHVDRILEATRELLAEAGDDRPRLRKLAHGFWQLRQAMVIREAQYGGDLKFTSDYDTRAEWFDNEVADVFKRAQAALAPGSREVLP